MTESQRIDLGTYSLPEGAKFRLAAEVREISERRTIVVSLHVEPEDASTDSELLNTERARYSIWLAKVGDNPWVPVDHSQGMMSIAEKDGEPYLYWHGKTPGARAFT